ncbi:MAG: hypothetical protein AAF614_20705 [Chloroflexota bacterium]
MSHEAQTNVTNSPAVEDSILNMPFMPKYQNPNITDEHLSAAIATMRSYFPDDPKLAEMSDEALKQQVEPFIKNHHVFRPTLVPLSTDSFQILAAVDEGDSCAYTIAVVVVDCIFMVLGFVGLHATNSQRIARAAAHEAGIVIARNLPKWRILITALKDASTLTEKATAIYHISRAAYSAGMFRGILASIKSSMKWWDWAITGLAAVAQIGALILTDGAAFIAEVALNGTAVAYVVSDAVKAGEACSN